MRPPPPCPKKKEEETQTITKADSKQQTKADSKDCVKTTAIHEHVPKLPNDLVAVNPPCKKFSTFSGFSGNPKLHISPRRSKV